MKPSLGTLIAALSTLLFLTACQQGPQQIIAYEDIAIIPAPRQMEQLGSGHYQLDQNSTLFCSPDFQIAGDFLQNYLRSATGWEWAPAAKESASIVITSGNIESEEGYTLTVNKDQIRILASGPSGAFNGVQSLRQILPPSFEAAPKDEVLPLALPELGIDDAPAFRYRGMHLDVGRHFFPKEDIKAYIAHLSRLKMNYFHWHLTEDQGWRIEIKKYPRLTSHAAYRNETLIGHYNDTPQQFDGKRYGGFYTQEDVKEIVAFATAHNITIIPEIEMPGHAQAAISAYPELSCTGKPIEVATKWGVFETIYCPSEKTFAFLKDVLSEVIELFPGEYIHIGGDEAPKAQWEASAFCQRLIAEKNLGDEHGLQSYFIKEIEQFLNSKGKRLMGWDEILEGGLAPDATVMSWRGMQGGIEAAKQGHDVIMTPTSHAYFDYYQADHPDEPLAIGGFLPLKKVYSLNPIPEELSQEEASYILGAQGNIWTEYMPTWEQVEYMAFPRLLAMSEVVWTGPSEDVEQEYPEFLQRVAQFHQRLDVEAVNYANHLYDLTGTVEKKDGQAHLVLKAPLPNSSIRFSQNEEPYRDYVSPITLTEDTQIRAQVFDDSLAMGRPLEVNIDYHHGLPITPRLSVPPHAAYRSGGVSALTNGIQGSDTRYGDSEWLGFWGEEVVIELDFPQPISLKEVSTRFFHAPGQWIYAPQEFFLRGEFETGVVFSTVVVPTLSNDGFYEVSVDTTELPQEGKIRSLRLRIPSYGTIPSGKQGAGNPAWTFIDEIYIL